MDPVDLLLAYLMADNGAWPPKREVRLRRHVATMRAFLEADRDKLKAAADWPGDRAYKVDPLPGLIADAWADHLFGEDPTITPADETDLGFLEAMLEGNVDLTGDLHAAERNVAGEGEQWWRVYADRDLADVPLVEWFSRDDVVPLYVGRRLVAVALVTELGDRVRGDSRTTVYRHLEVHLDGAVEHVLLRGSAKRLGTAVDLDQHPETEELAGVLTGGTTWAHGLPMLMGKVSNGRKRVRSLGNLGVSDYYGIADYLLDLNEAATIAAENARLTAKSRLILPESALKQAPAGKAYTGELVDRGDGSLVPANGRPYFDAGEDVLVVSELDAELGKGADSVARVLEYSFDAEALITHKRDLIESALTRVGLTPRYVGVANGEAPGVLSGTAYKLTLIPTTRAGNGKARPWDDSVPHVLSLMARLDALPEESGGFGRGWSDPTTMPAVERANPLPTDELEESTIESTLVGAGVRSKRTSVRAQHPDWTEEQVDEELQRISEDAPSPTSGIVNPALG